jgi:hypothetical protein
VTVLVVVLAASRLASAQTVTGTLPNSATISFPKLYTYQTADDKTGIQTEATSDDRLHYFNLAHCTCSKLSPNNKLGKFSYLVQETGTSGSHFPATFWTGTSCDTDSERIGSTATCKQVDSVGDLDVDLNSTGGSLRTFSLFDAINGLDQSSDCTQSDSVPANVYLLFSSTNATTMYDYSIAQPVGSLSGETTGGGVDTKPPPLPTDIRAAGTENGIDLSWTPPSSNNTDVAYYQALCAMPDGAPISSSPTTARYVTTQSICPEVTSTPQTLTTTTLDAADKGPLDVEFKGPPTGPFGELDSDFVCGESTSATASSLTIGGLDNDTPYQVILLSIDRHGNYAGTAFSRTVTPHAVTDFWEDLHERGSKVQGGLCLLAETYGDDSGLTQGLRAFRDDSLASTRLGRWLIRGYYATFATLGGVVHGSLMLRIIAATLLLPAVVLALACHALTLPGLLAALIGLFWMIRKRRAIAGWLVRRLRVGATAAILAGLALYAPRAHAGSGFQPYWETNDPIDDQNQPLPDEPGLVHWHVGIKVGPYIPDIDKQFGKNPGPYEQMFGNFRLLPMLDVERIIWSGYGQVGIGGTIGYLQRSARAFTVGSEPGNPDRARDPNARNSFHLIPFALTATYRFTYLDDEYGIPLVPYVRGGLSYYVWWMKAPNDNFSLSCKDMTSNDTPSSCSTTKAFGASAGIQGAIGLAIRAERIDAAAARSMRASGIQHAGIYGELSAAKVDGFGSDSKLSVGARTWFAGVDFEF